MTMSSDHIQIGDVSPVVRYVGDGTQTVFPYPFPIFSSSNLQVYLDDNGTAEAGGFAVDGAGNSEGGAVTFLLAPAAGRKVTLVRELPIERTSDFQEGEFRAKVLNDEFDKIIAQMQEISAAVSAAMRLATTDTTDTSNGFFLPERGVRAGNFLSFDESGAPVAASGVAPGDVVVSAFWKALLDDADGSALQVAVIAEMLAADQNWTGSQRSPFIAANEAALDFNSGQNFLITPASGAGAVTVAFSNLADGQGGNIVIDNTAVHATGFTWPSAANFGSAGTPTIGSERAIFSYMIQGATVDVRRV